MFRVLIYLLSLPLAVFLGYQLATPEAFTSYGFVALVVVVLSIPILLKWHHLMLILGWNAAVIVFFLPGAPTLGVSLAAASLGLSILGRTMNRNRRFISVPSVTASLLVLSAIVVVTAQLTGGLGGRALGAEMWGAKRYLGLFGAIVGYFALTAMRVPPRLHRLAINGYFLSAATAVVSDFAYMAGPSFYFLFALFPSDIAVLQAMTADDLYRLSGLSFAAMAVFVFLLVRYGIRDLFVATKPWRLGLVLAMVALSLLGGYRSLIILMLIVFATQFYFERLFKSSLFPTLLLIGVLSTVLLVSFVEKMPLSVQRALSFLPIDIDPSARQDAMSTLDWRLTMWKVVLPEVPRYLILGKGYAYSGTDYFLTQEAVRRGMLASYEDTLVSGNYHNGILTILVPFGIFGFLAFAWFCWAGFKVLHHHYMHGDPSLKRVNTFLLSYFVARLVFYLIFYGQFDLDLYHFTGAVGLCVALNGPVTKTAAAVTMPHVPAMLTLRLRQPQEDLAGGLARPRQIGPG